MLTFIPITAQTSMADDLWEITAYCACAKCCGKSDGIMANGKKAKYGYVACNWLPFGALVRIEDMGVFIVGDRGAKSKFGTIDNPIKHLDVYMPTHAAALKFGVQRKRVTIIGEEDTSPMYMALTAQHTMVRVKKLNINYKEKRK